MKTEKQIFLPVEDKKEMIETFKTTKETLWSALNFTTNSGFARILRAAAYERGGVLYPDPKCKPGAVPSCDTIFNTADRTMIQNFGAQVRLLGNLENGVVSMYVGGDLKTTYQNPTLVELGTIQATAQNLADELSLML